MEYTYLKDTKENLLSTPQANVKVEQFVPATTEMIGIEASSFLHSFMRVEQQGSPSPRAKSHLQHILSVSYVFLTLIS